MEEPRLVLGTVQLGQPYGVANTIGRPAHDMAVAIVREAWENGIREFDTAQAYGSSEEVLGHCFSELGIAGHVRVISKLNPNLDHLDAAAMSEALADSLARLGVDSLFGIMLHREEYLSLWGMGLSEVLRGLVLSGKVKHIGASVYSPEKAVEALQIPEIDMVQLPANILDRRFEKAGAFGVAAAAKKTVYVRSVFLQGLLLLSPDDLPAHLGFARPTIERFDALCHDLKMTPREAALAYVKWYLPTAKVVFGAETPTQVRENARVWESAREDSIKRFDQTLFDDVDERILNPALWPRPVGRQ